LIQTDSRLHVFLRTDPATTETYTLSLHDALPICHPPPAAVRRTHRRGAGPAGLALVRGAAAGGRAPGGQPQHRHAGAHRAQPRRDRKSTRLNSSHVKISYAVFCLKEKTNTTKQTI